MKREKKKERIKSENEKTFKREICEKQENIRHKNDLREGELKKGIYS